MIKNKIFPAKNELLQFDNLTGTLIQSLKDEIISETGSSLNQIKSISPEERTFENTPACMGQDV
jgi:hypothetical protein